MPPHALALCPQFENHCIVCREDVSNVTSWVFSTHCSASTIQWITPFVLGGVFIFIFISISNLNFTFLLILIVNAEDQSVSTEPTWSLCVFPGQRATVCVWQAVLLIHTWVRGHVAQECEPVYFTASLLQACMTRHCVVNVKPYRDQRKQSRSPSWQLVCVCVFVCVSIVILSLAGMLSTVDAVALH